MLGEAKQLLGHLNGIGATLQEPELLLRPLQRREALRSSSLEGTYASPEELLLFELKPRDPTSHRDRANAWLEVSNYGAALRQGHKYIQEGGPISLFLIRKLHEWLLRGVRGEDKMPGQFRDRQVHIGSDRRFIPTPTERLDECLSLFEGQLSQDSAIHGKYDPLVTAYILHYQFEAIHPFLDGNGRVGRLLLALMTALECNLGQPWLYMSAFFERYKDEYIDTLFRVSAEGAWEDWIGFCLRGTIDQAQDAIKRCDQLHQLRREMLDRLSTGSVRLPQIIERLFVNPIVTAPQLTRLFDVTYPTAKADIDRLIDLEILSPIEASSNPRAYFGNGILRIAYGDLS